METTPVTPIFEKLYEDKILIQVQTDRVEFYLTDATNLLFVLPLAAAAEFAADLVEHTTGALDQLEKPELTTLTLLTVLHPRPGIVLAHPTEDGVYQCPVDISQLDSFTSLTLTTGALMGMDTDPVDVYIDGTKNGTMATMDGITWAYIPSVPVNFTVGLHNITMQFIADGGQTKDITMRFASV